MEDFPEGGLLITLPYPQGTSKERHTFFAAHMFSHEMNGFRPGDIEIPKDVRAGEEGIQFTVYGLSPIVVAWKEAPAQPGTAETGNNNGAGGSNGESNPPGSGEGGGGQETNPPDSGEGANPPGNSGSGEGANPPGDSGGEGINPSGSGEGGSGQGTFLASNTGGAGSSENSTKAGSVQSTPRTGDTANIWFYELCLLISAVGGEYLYICFRKDRKKAVK